MRNLKDILNNDELAWLDDFCKEYMSKKRKKVSIEEFVNDNEKWSSRSDSGSNPDWEKRESEYYERR